MDEYLTRIYVRSRLRDVEIRRVLVERVGGDESSGLIQTRGLEIDVHRNAAYDRAVWRAREPDHKCFPWAVDVRRSSVDRDLDSYVGSVGCVMRALGAFGLAVASECEWRHRLPGAGRVEPSTDSRQERDMLGLVHRRLVWRQASRSPYPWKCRLGGLELEIHAGDWPAESTFLLYVNGRHAGDLDGWPKPWVKPGGVSPVDAESV
jgi:hypothetical protein